MANDDPDLKKIAIDAYNDWWHTSQPPRLYYGDLEAVLAAVTPIIERRARWKALEDVEDIAVTHAFRDTDGAAVVPFGILNDYIDNELVALDLEGG